LDHRTKSDFRYSTNEIRFLVNREPGTFADRFQKIHGPCLPTMGWRAKNAQEAPKIAVSRGARAATEGDYAAPAIYWNRESLIYFIDDFAGEEMLSTLRIYSQRHTGRSLFKGILIHRSPD